MSFSGNALYIPKHLALQTQIAVPSIVHLVGHSVSTKRIIFLMEMLLAT